MLKIKIIILPLLIILVSCTHLTVLPDWFGKLPHNDYEIIGYGIGNSVEEATARANKDIALYIRTHISSESFFEETLTDEEYSRKAKVILQEHTHVVLSEVVTIKQEHAGGIWYVAVRYENLPFEEKIAKRLRLSECIKESQNRYLSRTPLIRSINKELNCELDFKLTRNHGVWYISYDKVMVPLNRKNFERLFISYESYGISLIPSKTELVAADIFSFAFQSSQSGFASLLNICEDGEVFIISANQPIKANKETTIPDPSGEMELFAGLPHEGRPTYDLYTLIISNNKIDLSRIQQAGNKVEKGARHFKFDEVLSLMDEYDFSTVLIRSRPGIK